VRSNHALGIGISFVLACFEIGNARADCLVVITDSISKAFAGGELDAEAQKILDEEKLWGRNPLERAAEGAFTGLTGVTEYKVGDQTYETISFSLLSRDAFSKISFTNLRNQTSKMFVPHIVGLNFPPLVVHVVPPPGFGATPPITIVPTFHQQWIELDPTYTIAIKARPPC
jgi:hypothetical protein